MRDPKRLKRLLRIRTRVCDMRRAELSIAQERKRLAQEKLDQAIADEQARGQALVKPSERSAADLMTDVDLLQRAHKSTERSQGVVQERNEEVSKRSEAVHVARRDVKALERVEERLKKESDRRLARFEQERSDEAAARIGTKHG